MEAQTTKKYCKPIEYCYWKTCRVIYLAMTTVKEILLFVWFNSQQQASRIKRRKNNWIIIFIKKEK